MTENVTVPDKSTQISLADGLRLIRAEYLEIPGLRLTRQQVERFWGLDAQTCDAVLDALVSAGFLRCTQAGDYVRVEART